MQKQTISDYGSSFNIEIVTGGFIMAYPSGDLIVREVFPTSRKLQARIKELLESFETDQVETKE